jgi:hypothetical protein
MLPMPPPLVVRWLGVDLGRVRAGAPATATVGLENAGAATWRPGESRRDGIKLSYHWLDDRGNAIVWDGVRTELGRPVAPGEQLRVDVAIRGAMPPGRYRLALDLVDEGRFWLAEIGNDALEVAVDVAPRIDRRLAARGGDRAALAAQEEPLVDEHEAEAVAYLADGVRPERDWSRRVLDAHQEGFAAVGGSIDVDSGLLRRRPKALQPWSPGTGRLPGFAHPLLCPSVVRGVEPAWTEPVADLPALVPPADEPWLYDGRIAVRVDGARLS